MRIMSEAAHIRIACESQECEWRSLDGDLLKKIDTARVAKIVVDKLGKRFKDIEIVDVIVSSDKDRDGDEILRIQIIFKGVLNESDARQVAGATREVWPALEDELDDDLFPLLSFVSKVDYERGQRREAS